MQKNIWYNVGVLKTGEKKAVPMPIKVTDSIKHELEAIADAEDRPLGYVARELMIRGLALYEKDGRLRDEQRENALSNEGRQYKGVQTVPVYKKKTR